MQRSMAGSRAPAGPNACLYSRPQPSRNSLPNCSVFWLSVSRWLLRLERLDVLQARIFKSLLDRGRFRFIGFVDDDAAARFDRIVVILYLVLRDRIIRKMIDDVGLREKPDVTRVGADVRNLRPADVRHYRLTAEDDFVREVARRVVLADVHEGQYRLVMLIGRLILGDDRDLVAVHRLLTAQRVF